MPTSTAISAASSYSRTTALTSLVCGVRAAVNMEDAVHESVPGCGMLLLQHLHERPPTLSLDSRTGCVVATMLAFNLKLRAKDQAVCYMTVVFTGVTHDAKHELGFVSGCLAAVLLLCAFHILTV